MNPQYGSNKSANAAFITSLCAPRGRLRATEARPPQPLWWKQSSRFLVWSFRQCIHQPSTAPSAANAACSAQLSAICSKLRLHRSENFYFGLASAEWSRGGASLNPVISFVRLRRRQQVKGRNLATRKFSFCAIDHAEHLDFCFIWSHKTSLMSQPFIYTHCPTLSRPSWAVIMPSVQMRETNL